MVHHEEHIMDPKGCSSISESKQATGCGGDIRAGGGELNAWEEASRMRGGTKKSSRCSFQAPQTGKTLNFAQELRQTLNIHRIQTL